MQINSLEKIETHFEFGENWSKFSHTITPERIEQAKDSLIQLLETDNLTQKTVLDVGCGSGLFSLAACLLNAKQVVSIDIDPKCIETTKAILGAHYRGNNYACNELSVFELDPKTQGQYDIVYSWGVLHHTGNMYKAIEKAAAMVAPEGKFVIALYRKTKMCRFWKGIKWLYSNSPKVIQHGVKYAFAALILLAQIVRGRSPLGYIRNYYQSRGMSFIHDAHDWLGGYPYESISPQQLHTFAERIGFNVALEHTHPAGLGVLGSGCDEYVLTRKMF